MHAATKGQQYGQKARSLQQTRAWLVGLPATAPGAQDLAVCLSSVQERSEELRLAVVHNLDGVGEANVLSLTDTGHFLRSSIC